MVDGCGCAGAAGGEGDGMIIIVVCAVAFGWVAWLFLTAPYGWEDEEGFHYYERRP